MPKELHTNHYNLKRLKGKKYKEKIKQTKIYKKIVPTAQNF